MPLDADKHVFFDDVNRQNSAVFSYKEAEKDVLEWRFRWNHLAGLNLARVEDITALARGVRGFLCPRAWTLTLGNRRLRRRRPG